jgi:hypothetical protein
VYYCNTVTDDQMSSSSTEENILFEIEKKNIYFVTVADKNY